METIEERRARMENVAANKRLRLAMDMDEERKSRVDKMVGTTQIILALTKGVVNGLLEPILNSGQPCFSFKPDVHRHLQLKDTLYYY